MCEKYNFIKQIIMIINQYYYKRFRNNMRQYIIEHE